MKHERSQSPRAYRFHAGLPASIDIDGRDVECKAHDLSRTGALLIGEIPSPDTDEIWVTLGSPGGDLQLTLACRLARNERDAESGARVLGVEFLEVRSDDRSTLETLIARVIEGVAPAEIVNLPDNASPQLIREALDGIALPHRIQLAARGMPRERAILKHDPHLQVIDALARNPSLLLHELLALLRRRNILPHTLEAVGKNPRWASNEQVKVLVATHRNTPLGLADALIAQMGQATLQKVIQAPDLNPALRSKVLRRIPGGLR